MKAAFEDLLRQCRGTIWSSSDAILVSLTLIMRKGQLTKFIYDFQQREATQQIFRLLEYMVPVHVIVPMLRNPGAVIADEAESHF